MSPSLQGPTFPVFCFASSPAASATGSCPCFPSLGRDMSAQAACSTCKHLGRTSLCNIVAASVRWEKRRSLQRSGWTAANDYVTSVTDGNATTLTWCLDDTKIAKGWHSSERRGKDRRHSVRGCWKCLHVHGFGERPHSEAHADLTKKKKKTDRRF